MNRLCFLGDTHAADHLRAAAEWKGFTSYELHEADVVFVSMDTPTDEYGARDLDPIKALVLKARYETNAHIVLTSAVPPGFTRSLGYPALIHQVETLRISDAVHRARNPEMLVVGTQNPDALLPAGYHEYLRAFGCPILRMTWEEAEFVKLAINAMLIVQVEATNALAQSAAKVGADWSAIAEALRHDARIGPHAYLKPGRWQDSRHLLRDCVTLEAIDGI